MSMADPVLVNPHQYTWGNNRHASCFFSAYRFSIPGSRTRFQRYISTSCRTSSSGIKVLSKLPYKQVLMTSCDSKVLVFHQSALIQSSPAQCCSAAMDELSTRSMSKRPASGLFRMLTICPTSLPPSYLHKTALQVLPINLTCTAPHHILLHPGIILHQSRQSGQEV